MTDTEKIIALLKIVHSENLALMYGIYGRRDKTVNAVNEYETAFSEIASGSK